MNPRMAILMSMLATGGIDHGAEPDRVVAVIASRDEADYLQRLAADLKREPYTITPFRRELTAEEAEAWRRRAEEPASMDTLVAEGLAWPPTRRDPAPSKGVAQRRAKRKARDKARKANRRKR